MNRRGTLRAALAVSALCALPSGRAQVPTRGGMPTLGVLSPLRVVSPEEWARSPFWQPLRALGWVEDRNLRVVRASSYPDDDRLAGLAEELVQKRVDVIFAPSNEAALAAARATKTIPIVFWGVNYPVELGLVESLAHPGGNVTGVAMYVGPAESTKTLDYLKELAPRASRLAYVYESAQMRKVDGGRWEFADDYMEAAARRVGLESRQYAVSRDQDLERAFAEMLAAKTQAIYVSLSKFTIGARQRIIEFANMNHLPSAFNSFDDVSQGGLLCYGPDMRELFRRAADSVDKVLRGARPRDLPVELPTRFRLGINRRTAQQLGLPIPASLEARAERVVD